MPLNQNSPCWRPVAIVWISVSAFFEYVLQVPANRIGFKENGGPFTLFQLKIIQEVISLVVFTLFALLIFRSEEFKIQYLYSFLCIVLAVYFAFKK